MKPIRSSHQLSVAARGFTLLEVAIVVAVIGVVAAITVGAFADSMAGASVRTARAAGSEVVGALVAHARQQHHLPCPDADGDGRADGGAGACPAALDIGYVPYLTLGLSQPATRERALYTVYRNPAADADLVEPAAGVPQRRDLQHALQAAARIPGVAVDHAYLTGDEAAAGAVDCSNNRVGNPAVAIVLPLTDRDGDGNVFDGVNAMLPNAPQCLASSNRATDALFDDQVVALGFTTLLGLISRNSP